MTPPRIQLGRAYAPLLTCRDPFVFAEGPRGTAKSRSILAINVLRLLKYPGSRLLLCRRTRVDLGKTILATLEDQVFPSLGMAVPGGAHRENRSEYALPNGSRILPVGIDEGAKLYSAEATFAYVAEAIELTEKQVTDVAGCMRWLKSPERPTLCEWSQITVDANPGAPGHWVNKKAEDVDNRLRFVTSPEDYDRLQAHNAKPAADPIHRWKRIITKHQDNPGYWDHDAWGYTPLGQKYVGETLETYTGFQRERWLNGLWKSADGSVFPEFEEEKHVVTPFQIPSSWPLFVGWDPGYDHPTAILWIAVAPTGRYYVVDEIYEGGKSVEQHVHSVKAHNREKWAGRTVHGYYGDPQHAFSQTAQAIEPISAQFRKAMGTGMIPWPRSTDKEAMVNAVRRRLNSHGAGADLLDLRVFRTCPNTINEFQSWSYKRTAKGEVPHGDDQFEDANNHALDVVLGMVAMNLRYDRQGVRVIDGNRR